VKWLEKRLRFPRIAGILLLYILIILFLTLMIRVIVPPLLAEIPNFVSTLSLPPLPENLVNFNFDFTVQEISNVVQQVQVSFGAIMSIISSTFSGILTFFTILVMTSYLLLDRENLYKKVVWFSREKRHLDLAKELVDTIEIHLGGWVRGQLFLMFTIGLITYIGLSIFRIPYALPLALAAGLLEILPNLGPTISAVPAIIIAFGVYGPGIAGIMALFYIIVQQVENNFIVPKIMKANADVNPLTTITVILIGLKVANVLGALLAVPVYIVIRSVYSIWLREKDNL
jgi:predicted PurR-regulated permease PerM